MPWPPTSMTSTTPNMFHHPGTSGSYIARRKAETCCARIPAFQLEKSVSSAEHIGWCQLKMEPANLESKNCCRHMEERVRGGEGVLDAEGQRGRTPTQREISELPLRCEQDEEGPSEEKIPYLSESRLFSTSEGCKARHGRRLMVYNMRYPERNPF